MKNKSIIKSLAIRNIKKNKVFSWATIITIACVMAIFIITNLSQNSIYNIEKSKLLEQYHLTFRHLTENEASSLKNNKNIEESIIIEKSKLNSEEIQYYDVKVKIKNIENMSSQDLSYTGNIIAQNCNIDFDRIEENYLLQDSLDRPLINMSQPYLTINTLLLLVGILIIYNISSLAVARNIRQIGRLKAIGMSNVQVSKMLWTEVGILGGLGIIIGAIVSNSIGFFIFTKGFDLKSSFLITMISVLIVFIFLLFIYRIPLKKATSLSAINAEKYVETLAGNRKQKFTQGFLLTLGSIAFILVATIVASSDIEKLVKDSSFIHGQITLDISQKYSSTLPNRELDIMIENPFTDDFKNKLKNISGVTNLKEFKRAPIDYKNSNENLQGYVTILNRNDVNIAKDMLEFGDIDYDKMVDNQQIIIKSKKELENTIGKTTNLGDKITLSIFDGKETQNKEFTIGAYLNKEYVDIDNSYSWFLLPEDTWNNIVKGIDITSCISIGTEQNKYKSVLSQIKELVGNQEEFEIYSIDDEIKFREKEANEMYGLLKCLSFFLVGISLVNLINMRLGYMECKKVEFVTLRSLGLTSKQLRLKLCKDSFVLVVITTIISTVLGRVFGNILVMVLKMKGLNYMNYTFPTVQVLSYIFIIGIILLIVTVLWCKALDKKTLAQLLKEN